jgi:hypothetical protein
VTFHRSLCAVFCFHYIQGVARNPGSFRNKITCLSEKKNPTYFVQIWRWDLQ